MNTYKSIWFTGLSGSGKTTLSVRLKEEFLSRNIKTILLDGDDIRQNLNKDLKFSNKDRKENIRRVSEVNKILLTNNILTINAFILPTEYLRNLVKSILNQEIFLIYLSTPLKTCAERDVKGLYNKAINFEIKDFTGISSTFEPPLNHNISIDTSVHSVEQSISLILSEYQSSMIDKYIL